MRFLVVLLAGMLAMPARADDALPAPLRAKDVAALARAHRSEIAAAKARARAASQRSTIVSALEDPTISLAADHVPFDWAGWDRSAAIEQTFPLSRVRGHRARAAAAGAKREAANIERVERSVELGAVEAFWMLAEVRALAQITEQQHALVEQLVVAATARYASTTGTQADVLRAETERARLAAERRATIADQRGAEVMLNTSLARAPDAPIPALDPGTLDAEPPTAQSVARSSRTRPELRAGLAEIEQAEAEVRVMRSMYAPMAMVRAGVAETMMEGPGWMVMIGISIPLWRDKLRAGVSEATAMVEMANEDVTAMRRMAEGEARALREAVVAARERHRALRDDIVPRAEQAIAPTLAAYSAGQVPLVSVLEAARMLWSSRRELVMARTELGLAWARLRRATGEEVLP